MASTSTQIGPSFPPPPPPSSSSYSSSMSDSPWKYEVFLSFHGEDTRNSFTDHLHRDFERNGIIDFKDDKEMERGEYIAGELFKAIEESLYAVVVISENYAFSKWCLRELTKIMERKKEGRLKVFPVFYNVDPSDVRNLRGSFKTAFDQHRERGVDEGELNLLAAAVKEVGNCILDPPDIQTQEISFGEASASSRDDAKVEEELYETWRSTLTEAGYLAGWHVHNRSESTVIEEISKTVFEGLMRNLPEVPKFVVGMESPLMEMWKLLDIGSADVRYVGIGGMRGVGKTTLARVIYEKVSSQFTACCFVRDIGEASGKDLFARQKDLISKILTDTVASTLHGFDIQQGIQVLSSRLRGKRVFIVLDDVRQGKQIEALAGNPNWFGSGSRIILTGTTFQLLFSRIYRVKELNNADALSLFYHKAFNKRPPKKDSAEQESAKHSQRQSEEQPAKPHPENEFAELIQDIVDCAQGLPLALEIFGSFLYKVEDRRVWESYLEQLKADPPKDILKKLIVTFDRLDDKVQEAFMDIACFFNGWYTDNVIFKLKNLGYSSESILLDLERRCLIKFSKDKKLFMHNLLAQMGKKIAGHSRLWRTEDIISTLRKPTELGEVKSIVLNPHFIVEKLCYDAFSAMQNLRMIWINPHSKDKDCERGGCQLKTGPESLFFNNEEFRLNSLRVLGWEGCPSSPLSNGQSFEPADLVELSLRNSNITKLWDGDKHLLQLKFIDLSSSEMLIEIPSLKGLQNLEILNLSFCINLSRVNSSIGCLNQLRKLLLEGCCSLEQLPEKFHSTSLEVLDLSQCSKLKMFPDISSSSACLRNLDISGTNIEELPFSMAGFLSLEKFHAFGTKIKELPSLIISSEKLKDLSIVCFESVIKFQLPSFSALSSLEVLKLRHCNISDEANPLDLSGLSLLKDLDLSYNTFTRMPDSMFQVPNLHQLSLNGCRNLQKLSNALLSSLRSLWKVSLSNGNLSDGVILNSISCLSSISSLDLSYNRFKKLPESICELFNLDELVLVGCTSLRTLSKLPLKLHSLHLRDCPLLETSPRHMTSESAGYMSRIEVCSSIVSYIGFDDKPHKILYLHPESPVYTNRNDHLIEPLAACGPTLGPKISEWFDQRGTGSNKKVQIHVDGSRFRRALACALFIGYEVQDVPRNLDTGAREGGPEFVCQLQLKEKGPEQPLIVCIPEVTCIGSHGVWVFMTIPDPLEVPLLFLSDSISFPCMKNLPAKRCMISIIANSENVELKECGARILYADADVEFSKFVSSISGSGLDYRSLDYSLNRFLFVTGPIKYTKPMHL